MNSGDLHGAVPIAAERDTEINGPKRPIYLRKPFSVESEIKRARLYITALGIYEAEVNGQRVGDHVLAPGYNFRHVYDTYDITDLVRRGDNAISTSVGERWFAGTLTSKGGHRNNYGDTIGLLSLLTVTLTNGTIYNFPTDETWQANTGPLISS